MLGEVQHGARAAQAVRTLAELVTGRTPQNAVKKGGFSFLPFLGKRKAG
jgi:hypothetical protein